MDNREQGKYDCRAYYFSQGYGSYTRNVKAEDAMKLFWPPVQEALVQYVAPIPKDRKEWLAGFKEEQAIILSSDEYRRLSDKPGLVSDDLK